MNRTSIAAIQKSKCTCLRGMHLSSIFIFVSDFFELVSSKHENNLRKLMANQAVVGKQPCAGKFFVTCFHTTAGILVTW